MNAPRSFPPALLIPVLLTIFVYAKTLNYDFVWDDFTFILNWPSLDNFSQSWQNFLLGETPAGHSGVYRPIRSFIYALSFHFFSTNPAPYHLQALLIHLLSTLLVYALSKNLHTSTATSIIAATIFGLHPSHVETITFITTSFDAIGILFALISLYYYTHHTSQKKHYHLSTLFAFLAFFTYEITLILPLILLVYELTLSSVKKYIPLTLTKKLLPFFLFSGIYWFLRFFVLELQSDNSSIFSSLYSQLSFTLTVLLKYIALAIFPGPLNLIHTIQSIPAIYYFDYSPSFLPSFTLTTPIILSLFSVLLIMAYLSTFISKKLLIFLSAFFIIPLIPVLQIFPQDIIFSEKYLYFSTVASSIFLAIIFSTVIKKATYSSSISASLSLSLFTFYLVYLATNTIGRNQSWQNTQTLWSYSITQSPNSALSHNNLASDYLVNHKFDIARALLLRASHQNPNQALIHSNLGLLYQLTGDTQTSIKHQRTAQALEPANLQYLQTLISSLLLNHDYDQAITHLHQLEQINPNDPTTISQLAHAYHQTQNLQLAIDYYQKVIILDPSLSASAHNNLGNIYQALGETQLAITHFQTALDLDPDHPFAQKNLQLLQNP